MIAGDYVISNASCLGGTVRRFLVRLVFNLSFKPPPTASPGEWVSMLATPRLSHPFLELLILAVCDGYR